MPDRTPLSDRVHRDLDGAHPLVAIETDDEAEAWQLVFNAVPAEVPLRSWSAIRGLGEGRLAGAAIADTDHAAAAMAWLLLRAPAGRSVVVLFDLSPHLDDARARRALRELVEHQRAMAGCVVLVERSLRLPPELDAEAHRIAIDAPSAKEIERSIREGIQTMRGARSVRVSLRRSTLDAMVRGLRGLTRRQIARLVAEAAGEDGLFDDADLERVIRAKRNALGGLGGVLEFVESPVSMDAIGGLGRLKAWLAERSLADADEAGRFGLSPPRGLLMLGVQGAGKSLAAKAVATAWRVPLLRLDPGALFDRYIGESERRLRESLEQAERMSPAVLWIDEIEKGFAGAAATSSDGGLSRRMFGTLLTWMQEHREPLFIAATANDVSALPPELLRKGRFDEVFFVDLPGLEARATIVAIHLERRGHSVAAFDLPAIAAASEGFSGAELEAAVEAAMRRAFADNRRPPTTVDLLEAVRRSPPLSTLMSERVAALRAWAANRCVPAD